MKKNIQNIMRNHSFKTFGNKLKNNIDTDAYMEIIQRKYNKFATVTLR